MSIWGWLRKKPQAVQESPNLAGTLEAVRSELRQARQELEKSEENYESLLFKTNEQQKYMDFLSHKSEALQDALMEFCPRLSALEDMKRFYDTISPSLDAQGFTLYHVAKELTGIDVPSLFPYEDNRGLFEEMDGQQLLYWLSAVRFNAVEWEPITGSCYEAATLGEVDSSTPEYQKFERELYRAVLTRMGFGDLLAPEHYVKSQEREVIATEEKITELKLYSSLSAELSEDEYDDPQLLDSGELTAFQEAILQGIEDERLPEEEERGLMTYFDGSEAVNEKVISIFPTVEEMDGKLYGVAVCQVKGTLIPGELAELKDYCRSQYADGWGEGFALRSRATRFGDLYVNFWQDKGFFIQTKEELETAKMPARSRPQVQRGGER